MIILNYYPRF